MAYQVEKYKEPEAMSASIAKLVDSVSNQKEFVYDPLADATYQAYAEKYNRLGQQANENTMANVAAQTGGLASSYAVQAASQAQNQYNQQLADKIPELEQLAYERFNADRSYNLDALGALSDARTADYSIFSGDRDAEMNAYQYDTSLAEDKRQFDVSQAENKRQFDVAQAESRRQFNLSYKLDKDAQTYEQMLNRWKNLGYADKDVAKYFGVPAGTRTSDAYFNDASNRLAQKKSVKSINNTKEAKKATGKKGSTKSKKSSKKKSSKSKKSKSSKKSSSKVSGYASASKSSGTTKKKSTTKSTKLPKIPKIKTGKLRI